MKTQHSKQWPARRKFFLMLPLLVIPFLTLGFWKLGGGEGDPSARQVLGGINFSLPGAVLLDSTASKDKTKSYEQAKQDSLQRGAGVSDVFLRQMGFSAAGNKLKDGSGSFPAASASGREQSEHQIQSRLAQIRAEISKPAIDEGNRAGARSENSADAELNDDVNRLEQLMETMGGAGRPDPEIAQLDSLMEKIMAIQNPELARQQSSALGSKKPERLFDAIPVEIPENQKVRQGSVIALRLLDSVRLSGQVIPKGHTVYGLADFSNQRINLEIRNIRMGNLIMPVDLTVFDKRDGMSGIYAPEALIKDALNSGSMDAVGRVDLRGFDQNLGAQVASAGLDAAKRLFSRKVGRIKVKLRQGRTLLLKDNTRNP